MTIPASAGVRSTSWRATLECDARHMSPTERHGGTTARCTSGETAGAGWDARGERGNAQRVHLLFDAGDVRRPIMEGAVDRRALALLVAATAKSRCRPLAGRSTTVLKSCVGVASQRGCAPCDGARGADPAPVWRKC